MDTFLWLLIGHLLGEWLLQNDWMYFGQQRGPVTLPGLIRLAVYTLTVLGWLWLAGVAVADVMTWLAMGVMLFASHWLIDQTGLVPGWVRFYGQTDHPLAQVMVDQILHLLVLAGLSLYVSRQWIAVVI